MKAKKAGEYFCNEEAKRDTDLLKHVSELLLVIEFSGFGWPGEPQAPKTFKKAPCKEGKAKGDGTGLC